MVISSLDEHVLYLFLQICYELHTPFKEELNIWSYLRLSFKSFQNLCLDFHRPFKEVLESFVKVPNNKISMFLFVLFFKEIL